MSYEQQPEQTIIHLMQQAVAETLDILAQIKNLGEKPKDYYIARTGATEPFAPQRVAFRFETTPELDMSTKKLISCHRVIKAPPVLYIPYCALQHRAIYNALQELVGETPLNSYASDNLHSFHAVFTHIDVIDDLDAYYKRVRFGIAPQYARTDPNTCTQLGFGPSAISLQGSLEGAPTTLLQVNSFGNLVYFGKDTPLWKVREKIRLSANCYTRLPQQILAMLPQEVLDTQFPHMASKEGNRGLIAYTQTPTAGMLDRQQVIKPGRYLHQHLPYLDDESIKQLTAICAGAAEYQILHTRDADKIAEVYMNGPSSCMSYDEDRFGLLVVDGKFFHPSRVYAHPDSKIELVYMVATDRIVARVLINKATKRYPRIYKADHFARAETLMADYLSNKGYQQDDSALEEQPLLRVSPDRYPNAIICPYIDNGNMGVCIKDDRLIIGGNYSANHASGCLEDYDIQNNYWTCDCCGDEIDGDYDDPTDTIDHNNVCPSCIDEYYTLAYDAAGGCEEYVRDEDTYECISSGRTLHFGNQSAYSSGYCELSDRYYNHREVAPLEECVTTDDGDYVLLDDLDRLDLFFYEDEARPIDDYAVLDGEVVHTNEIDADLHAETAAHGDYPMLSHYTTIAEEDAA